MLALTTITRNGMSQRRHRIRNTVAGVDLALPGMLILGHCCNHGPTRVTDLANVLDMPPSVVTRESKRLEAQGLVSRSTAADDARVVRFEPTRAGRRAFERYRAVSDAEMRGLLADWAPSDVRAFAEQLERLVEDLRSKGDTVYPTRPARAG